jgi:transcription antitermination factor NusA-like protein
VLQLGEKLAQEGTCVGDDGQIGRIIAAEFGGIDIDVYEFADREIPGLAWQPG